MVDADHIDELKSSYSTHSSTAIQNHFFKNFPGSDVIYLFLYLLSFITNDRRVFPSSLDATQV